MTDMFILWQCFEVIELPVPQALCKCHRMTIVCNWMYTLTKAWTWWGNWQNSIDLYCEIGEVCEDDDKCDVLFQTLLQTVATGAWPEAAIAVRVGVILKLDWRFTSWIAGKVSVQCFDPKNGARALPARQRLTSQEAARVKCRAVWKNLSLRKTCVKDAVWLGTKGGRIGRRKTLWLTNNEARQILCGGY